MAKQDTTTTTPPPPSAITLLLGTLFRPRAAFAQLRTLPRRTGWVVFLILAALVAAPRYFSDQRQQALALQSFGATQVGPSEGFGPAPGGAVSVGGGPIDNPGQFAPQPSPVASVLSALGGVVGLPVYWLLMTIGMTLVLIIVGGRAGFGDVFKVLMLASAPLAVRGLVQLGYVLLLGQPLGQAGLSGLVTSAANAISANPNNPNAPPVLPPAPPGFGTVVWTTLLGQIDIFQVWALALVIIGVVVVAQVKTAKAALAVVLMWLLVGVIYALPALVVGAFAT